MKSEKISSLHDDILTPKTLENLGEYDNYPNRFDPKDKSVLTRLNQFGVDLEVVKDIYGKEIKEFTWKEYIELVGESIKARYDTIVGSVFDKYTLPNPENPDSDKRWKEMTELVKHYEGMAGLGLSLIKRRSDFKESGNLVLGLEAGANLINSMGDVKKIEDLNIKIFGFQYGKDTPLATNTGGLTKLGNEVVKYLFDHNLIIDLAHASYKTRRDIMGLADENKKGNLISYTHGSSDEDILDSWKDKIGERALKKEELVHLVKMGGIIGLGVTRPFFSSTRKVAERINDVIQFDKGIDRISIGTDFGGLVPDWLNDIRNPDDFKKLADVLSEDFGISDENVNKILRLNAREWIKKAID